MPYWVQKQKDCRQKEKKKQSHHLGKTANMLSSILKTSKNIDAPDISKELVIIDQSKNTQNISFDGLSENNGNNTPNRIINIKLILSAYNYISSLAAPTDFFGTPTGFRKHLRFKSIACFSKEEENFYISSPFALLRDNNIRKTKIFSSIDFRPTSTIDTVKGKKYILEIDNTVYKEKVSDIKYFSIIFFAYYDLLEIAKDLNISLESVEEPERLFSSIPVVFNIVEEKKITFDNLPITTNFVTLESVNTNLNFISNFKFSNSVSNNLFKLQSNLIPLTDKIDRKETLKTLEMNEFSKKFEKQAYFSSIFTSQDLEGASDKTRNILRYGFFFDYKNYMLDNAAFSDIIKASSQEIKDKFYEESKILDVKIYRIRDNLFKHRLTGETPVNFSTFNDRSGDTSTKLLSQGLLDEAEPVLIEEKIKKNQFGYLDGLEFFSGVDKSIGDITKGKYKYKTTMKLLDGSYYTVHRLKERLIENLSFLKEYYNLSKIPELITRSFIDNPHIDSPLEYSSLSVKKGYYNPTENRFNDGLSDKNDELQNIVNDYKEIYLTIVNSDSKFENEKIQNNKQEANEIASTMINLIKPNFGNPSGVLKVINMYESLIEKINYLLNSKGSSISIKKQDGTLERSFIKSLDLEEVFDNFIFEADSAKNFGLNYFSRQPLQNYGLGEFNRGYLEDLTFNKKLTYIILPDNVRFYRINITDKDAKLSNETGDKVYNALENILVSFNEENFKNISSSTQAIKNLVNNDVAETNSIFNNLKINGINLDNKKLLNIPFSTTNKSEQEIKSKQRILNSYKNNNFSKISNSLNNIKQNFKNKKTFSDNVTLVSKYIPFNLTEYKDTNLEKTSRFKIKEQTTKKIYYISFQKQYGRFLLKDPVYLPLNSASTNEKFLCLLGDQNLEDQEISQNFFPFSSKIPVFNDYFIFDNSDIEINTQLASQNEFVINVNLPKNILSDSITSKILSDTANKLTEQLGAKIGGLNINNNSLNVPSIKESIPNIAQIIKTRTIFDTPRVTAIQPRQNVVITPVAATIQQTINENTQQNITNNKSRKERDSRIINDFIGRSINKFK
jgi:hypothetical protein